jgi:hypothetical protein
MMERRSATVLTPHIIKEFGCHNELLLLPNNHRLRADFRHARA